MGPRFPLEAVLPPDLAARVRQLASRGPTPHVAFTAEFDRTGADGSAQRFEVRAVRASAGEAVCLVRDYSERRAAEVDLQQAERATLRSRLETQRVEQQHLVSLGTIAAGLGHEINNPLAYLHGNLSFLKAELQRGALDAAPGRASELAEALDDALEGSERIRRLVHELKVLAPPPALDRLETVDVRAVADAAIAMTQHLAQGKAVVQREYGEVPLIQSNGAALAQVCFNLLANAVQAIAAVPGGPGTISVRIGAGPDQPVTLEISDTGCGISPEVLPRIFDPFFTTREVGNGVGLGLAACDSLVRTLGGTISVQTQAGKGSTFRVAIPRGAENTTPRTGLAAVPTPVPHARRVLLVDDDPNVLQAVTRLLRGHHVSTAEGGEQALALLADPASWDVVLCDLYMPGLDGFSLFARTQAQWPHLAARFVFMTGFAASPRVRAFLEAHPGHRCLEKPFSAQAVRALVRQGARDDAAA